MIYFDAFIDKKCSLSLIEHICSSSDIINKDLMVFGECQFLTYSLNQQNVYIYIYIYI